MPRDENHQPQERVPWHALSIDDVLGRLEVRLEGLSSDAARRQLEENGPNILHREQTRPWWRRLLSHFNNVLIIILLIAGAITILLGRWVDAGAIFGVVLINAAIGFIQEGKAESALEHIKGMLSPRARVRRDGGTADIPAEEVVPGDIVQLQAGDRVPADIRLSESNRLRVEEAALTGESEPVDKTTDPVDAQAELGQRSSIAHAGTLVAQGSGEGIVVETGWTTEIGRISEMLEKVETVQTPLLRQIDRFAKVLAAAIIVLAAAMALFGYFVHGQDPQEMFLAAVGLAVAAIPQGLPVLMTVTLALGVQRMAQRNAVIRQLPAVETLGSVSTIFSDKTGTLTRNEMTVRTVLLAEEEVRVSGEGFAPEGAFYHEDDGSSDGRGETAESGAIQVERHSLLQRLLTAAALCNDADLSRQDDGWTIQGDPTEGALAVAAAKAGYDLDDLRAEQSRRDEIPFDPERKYMATLNDAPESQEAVVHVKGAPEVLIDICARIATSEGNQDLDRDAWKKRAEDLSAQGTRVLALAEKPYSSDRLDESEVGRDLVLLGLVGMVDPPRDAAITAVERCHSAHIRVKMVTGDHALTARAIGAQLGLQNTEEAITGREVAETSDDDLYERVANTDVFARTSPENKLRLVEAVQAAGDICVMTGDGVNDAPALKRADVGVAMGVQGTEAAKEAAEMVLADDNFASIAHAVEEGRTVYDNIKKAITFLLPTNGGEALAIMGAVLFGTALPILPVQILWVNMITAVTLGIALAFEPAEENVMARRPRDPAEPILNRFLVWRVVFVSLLLVIAVFGIFLHEVAHSGDLSLARTAAVNILVAGEIAYLFNTRVLTESSVTAKGLLGSRPALIAVVAVILAQAVWTYTPPFQFLFASAPLEPWHWGVIAAVAAAVFALVEVEKAIRRRRLRQ